MAVLRLSTACAQLLKEVISSFTLVAAVSVPDTWMSTMERPATTKPAALIQVDRLTFEYPRQRALEDVSFGIAENSITALVGPNGAGKTTLLRCIAGLDRPLRGHIEVCGVDVVADPITAHTYIGYLSDFFGLYDRLTVEQCLSYVAAAYGIDDVAGTVAETLALVQLEPMRDKRAGELSRGYRQRLGIAQAIIHRPTVLLLDEPASGLDPEARAELAALLRILQSEEMTIIVSSHILAELTEYSSHMLVLREGRVVDMQQIERDDNTRLAVLRIEVVDDQQRLSDTLDQLEGWTTQEVSAQQCTGTFSADARDQAALLRKLLDVGLEVRGFAEVEADMQSRYLNLVRRM